MYFISFFIFVSASSVSKQGPVVQVVHQQRICHRRQRRRLHRAVHLHQNHAVDEMD
jgi:hypothetical protein